MHEWYSQFTKCGLISLYRNQACIAYMINKFGEVGVGQDSQGEGGGGGHGMAIAVHLFACSLNWPQRLQAQFVGKGHHNIMRDLSFDILYCCCCGGCLSFVYGKGTPTWKL